MKNHRNKKPNKNSTSIDKDPGFEERKNLNYYSNQNERDEFINSLKYRSDEDIKRLFPKDWNILIQAIINPDNNFNLLHSYWSINVFKPLFANYTNKHNFFLNSEEIDFVIDQFVDKLYEREYVRFINGKVFSEALMKNYHKFLYRSYVNSAIYKAYKFSILTKDNATSFVEPFANSTKLESNEVLIIKKEINDYFMKSIMNYTQQKSSKVPDEIASKIIYLSIYSNLSQKEIAQSYKVKLSYVKTKKKRFIESILSKLKEPLSKKHKINNIEELREYLL